MDQLFIFPFNGNGLEALSSVKDKFKFLGFIDDNEEKIGLNKMGFKVFNREILKKYPQAKILAVPGSPSSYKLRDQIISGINKDIIKFPKVINQNAYISPLAKIGYNVLIMTGVVITANAIIGNHVCILPNTVIHHDSSIGDYSLIGSNVTIAGNSSIGKKCYIGSCSSIINNIVVEDSCLIGMGTNVIKSVSEKSIIVGNPGNLI